ncbi:nucleotide exchange factor GrpE [Paenibacillus cremeus]|uniref:Protein GrpE n=1 Tax=Paenibacillus cremeus TaxID=2163881 RepID=A0A559KAG2_9BACL|nr:nucleotide exchange factor GrpE [Paenibacillus cremeus]TVY09114.1 nucleotide exchange factor GrpE [Paenibacillus cremeus]
MNTEQQQKAAQASEENNETTYGADVTEEAGQDAAAADQAAETSEPQGAVQLELEQLRKQADENQQRFLRAQADFDNFRRRTAKEKEEFAKYASLKLIEQLLPVVDNFERALAVSKDNKDHEALTKGVEMIFRQLDQVLASEGLKPMESVGTPFNPEFHQAIMQVESDEHEEGIVVEEVQKGYLLKDKVLRPAMVKVSS